MSRHLNVEHVGPSLTRQVEKSVVSRGYILANINGNPLSQTDLENNWNGEGFVVIVSNDRRKSQKWSPLQLFSSAPFRQVHMILGRIWLCEVPSYPKESKGATETNWVISIHGQENVDLVQQLAQELMAKFSVDITVRLMREEPEFEDIGD